MDGTGPYLFLVGAPVGIAGFSKLAEELSDRYTVVLHDPRGIGLSTCGTNLPPDPVTLASDLASLIKHITNKKVLVFGASGGAVTGLELFRQHEGLIEYLIAHEPPVFSLLPDHDSILAAADSAFTLASDDPAAGMQAFADLTEIFHATYQELPRPQPVPLPPFSAEENAKNKYFLTRMAGPTVHYAPDIKLLEGKRLLIAAGEASIGQPARKASLALSTALGKDIADAPGGHFAFSTMPKVFAGWIYDLLTDK